MRVAQDVGYLDFPSIVLWPVTGVAVYSVIFFLFYHYGWCAKIGRALVNIPDISGKWSLEGIPGVRSQGSKESWRGEIEIEQNYERIYIILRTEQSQSQSNSASLVPEGPRYRLIYSYRNEPRPAAHELQPHHGHCALLFDPYIREAEGSYFNGGDRVTHGTMKLVRISPHAS